MQKHKMVDSRKETCANGYVHVVSIPWAGQGEYWWNEACADVLEVFGLPGGRFTSHPKMNQMDFHFKSKKDAELCKVLLSERLCQST